MPATITFNQFTIFIDDTCRPRCTPDDIQLVIDGMVDGIMRDWRPADGHPLRKVVDELMLRLQKAVTKRIEIPAPPPGITC